MAEGQSRTTPEIVAKTMIDEHSDFLSEAVAMVVRELVEAEISSEIGARARSRPSGRPTETAIEGRSDRTRRPQKA